MGKNKNKVGTCKCVDYYMDDENNHWVISKTIFKAKSTLQTEIKDQLIKVIFSGKP